MMEWSQVMPLIATLFGALVAGLLGMVLSGQNEIKAYLSKLNGTVFEHITKTGIHETAVVRIDERIASLLKVSEAAHARLDRVEART